MADPTPAASKKAADLGIDIDAVAGSGKDGRVTAGDVEKHAHADASADASAPALEANAYVGQEPLATSPDAPAASDLGAGYEATHGGPPEATDRNELWREAQESGHDDVSPTGDFIDGPDAAPESA